MGRRSRTGRGMSLTGGTRLFARMISSRRGSCLDDETAAIYSRRAHGVRVLNVPDTCHSGSQSKFVDLDLRPRFLESGLFDRRMAPLEAWTRLRSGRIQHPPRRLAPVVNFAACLDREVAYDAVIRGRANGAFTRAALDAWPEHRTTFGSWHRSTVALLDREAFPQTPTLFSARWQRYLVA